MDYTKKYKNIVSRLILKSFPKLKIWEIIKKRLESKSILYP